MAASGTHQCEETEDGPGVLTGWSSETVSDAVILRESRERPERFAEIFDAYHREIHRYVAGRLSIGHADDVAAETFLVAFRGRDRFVGRAGQVRAWLYGIATNLIRRHRRDEERKYRALGRAGSFQRAERGDGDDDRAVARVDALGVQRDLMAAMRSLRPRDRDVLSLVALADLSYAEVADALGISQGTVASRLNRARKAVRAALGGSDPTSETIGTP